jgi:cardiolipin synthase
VVSALPASLGRRLDLRYHRKVLVVDHRVAYIGSQNVVDPRFFKQSAGVGEWVDAVVRMEGPAISQVTTMFDLDWSLETGTPFASPPDRNGPAAADAGALVQVVPSGPAHNPDALRQLLLTSVYSARRRLTITTPYFVPDDAVTTALTAAALAGVDVTLVLPERNDSRLVRYASAASFEDLLKAGVRIALFTGGLLHTKSMVVDESVTLFGSVNVDTRSLRLNFEDSIIVYDPTFASEVLALQDQYLRSSRILTANAWQARGRGRRLLEDATRLVGPLL